MDFLPSACLISAPLAYSMLEYILLLIGLTSPDYTASVSVTAAHTLQATPQVEATKCCGACKNGVITHGDGHRTPCPCPPDCKCKAKGAVIHPPVQIPCVSGTCTLKR